MSIRERLHLEYELQDQQDLLIWAYDNELADEDIAAIKSRIATLKHWLGHD